MVAKACGLPFGRRSIRHSMVLPSLLNAASVCCAAGSLAAFGP